VLTACSKVDQAAGVTSSCPVLVDWLWISRRSRRIADSIPGSASTAAQRALGGVVAGISREVTSPMKRAPSELERNAENAWVGELKKRRPAARYSGLSLAMALPTTPEP